MSPALSEAHFPFLARLSNGGRRELDALTTKRVGPRRSVLRRGDSADGAYLVVGGALRVFYISAAGREATLYHVEPGGTCVLALTSTLAGQPYPAWVQAGPSGAPGVVGQTTDPDRAHADPDTRSGRFGRRRRGRLSQRVESLLSAPFDGQANGGQEAGAQTPILFRIHVFEEIVGQLDDGG
ncbi:MAG: cyclic nucleotide-binding domain-containing protein [Pseudomonadota bacterium]